MTNAHGDTDPSVADLPACHRDLLWALSQTGPSESLQLKSALASYYTDGIDHRCFCETLTELVKDGFVTKHAHDRHTVEYRLTETGRRALSTRQAWQAGCCGDTTAGGSN